ncbi:MAG: DUF2130 domain-containing protein [Fimbriimonadaceae bacterium]|nr:MAG: DUF2130 domain-containing protein [Fimbriimonadaceae bacterium]
MTERLARPFVEQAEAKAKKLVEAAQKQATTAHDEAKKLIQEAEERIREATEMKEAAEAEVSRRLAHERQTLRNALRAQLVEELQPELETAKTEQVRLRAELAQAKAAELALRKQKGDVEEREKNLELEVARQVDNERNVIRQTLLQEAESAHKLQIAEKDKLIAEMHEKVKEAQRKAELGSQQRQGEVLEVDFETTLRQSFPRDTIEAVKTGHHGADIRQRVLGNMGGNAGLILWEVKRAQNWGTDWCTKVKQDAAEAKADIAVIVSEVLPKDVRDFAECEGVWVVRPSHAVALCIALRQGLEATAQARAAATGRESKEALLYSYLTGPEFRTVMESMARPFQDLKEDLESEKRATQARWARQEKRIERILAAIAGLQGDLQGIVGKEMPALPGFDEQLEETEHARGDAPSLM